MRYFDKDRPLICHKPAYLAHGLPVAPLPDLYITPDEEGYMTVSAVLLNEDRGGEWHTIDISSPEKLIFLLNQWLADPEETLAQYFNYMYIAKAKEKPKTISLGDLLSLDELLS